MGQLLQSVVWESLDSLNVKQLQPMLLLLLLHPECLVCSSNRDAGGYCFCTIKWFASSKLATPWTVQQMWLYSAKLMHFLSCETNAKSFGKRKQMPESSDSPKPWRAAVKDWSTWAKAQKTHSLKFKLAMGHCCEIQACDSFLLIGTKVETANLATFQLQLLSGFIPDPHRVVLPDHHSRLVAAAGTIALPASKQSCKCHDTNRLAFQWDCQSLNFQEIILYIEGPAWTGWLSSEIDKWQKNKYILLLYII